MRFKHYSRVTVRRQHTAAELSCRMVPFRCLLNYGETMSNYGDLLPAYRDYKTAKEAKSAFLEGKDWIISSMFHPECGRYINIEDIKKDGVKTVILRFCQQRKITSVKL